MEFSTKNLEKTWTLGPKTLRKPGIWYLKKRWEPWQCSWVGHGCILQHAIYLRSNQALVAALSLLKWFSYWVSWYTIICIDCVLLTQAMIDCGCTVVAYKSGIAVLQPFACPSCHVAFWSLLWINLYLKRWHLWRVSQSVKWSTSLFYIHSAASLVETN